MIERGLPTAIAPLGPRSIGAYAPCALCSVLAPLRDPEHVTLRVRGESGVSITSRVEVAPPVGCWLKFGAAPICPTHAAELAAARAGQFAGPRQESTSG